jgi:hypothetical protein
MTRETIRDRIWVHVLEESVKNGNVVDASSISDAVDCSRKTAGDVLKVMDRNRWIRERSTKYGVEYHPEYSLSD